MVAKIVAGRAAIIAAAVAAFCIASSAECRATELRELLKIEERLIPESRPWRRPERKLTPEYITIHSTDNEAAGANALAHAKLLASPEGLPSTNKLSRTGFRSWHFTVDDQRIVQHLPTAEQGDHADFTGPGNQVSVGVEICVNRDGDLATAVARAAALTAKLMRDHGIDADLVVPHHHWAQPPRGVHKRCPAIFMENGRPGEKWARFKAQVSGFYDQLTR